MKWEQSRESEQNKKTKNLNLEYICVYEDAGKMWDIGVWA